MLIAGSLLLFGLDALSGPIQVALILCVLTVAFAVFCHASPALSVLYGIIGFKIGKPDQPGYGRSWADDHG